MRLSKSPVTNLWGHAILGQNVLNNYCFPNQHPVADFALASNGMPEGPDFSGIQAHWEPFGSKLGDPEWGSLFEGTRFWLVLNGPKSKKMGHFDFGVGSNKWAPFAGYNNRLVQDIGGRDRLEQVP